VLQHRGLTACQHRRDELRCRPISIFIQFYVSVLSRRPPRFQSVHLLVLQPCKKCWGCEALPRKVCSLLLHKSKTRGESNGAHKSDRDGSSESPEGVEGATGSTRNCSLPLHWGGHNFRISPYCRPNLLTAIFRCIALPPRGDTEENRKQPAQRSREGTTPDVSNAAVIQQP